MGASSSFAFVLNPFKLCLVEYDDQELLFRRVYTSIRGRVMNGVGGQEKYQRRITLSVGDLILSHLAEMWRVAINSFRDDFGHLASILLVSELCSSTTASYFSTGCPPKIP